MQCLLGNVAGSWFTAVWMLCAISINSILTMLIEVPIPNEVIAHSGRSSALVAARSAGYRLQIMVC